MEGGCRHGMCYRLTEAEVVQALYFKIKYFFFSEFAGEGCSLGVFLVLLCRSLPIRGSKMPG